MLEKTQIGSNVYAVYDRNIENAELDELSIIMINSNRDKKTGLAPISFEAVDEGGRKLHYDITGRVTLKEYLGRSFTQDEFKKLILNLVNTIEGFDEYMISVSKVLFDLNGVYINLIDGSICFLCIALTDYKQENTLFNFFNEVISSCYPNGGSNGINYYDLVRNAMRSEAGFSLSNIRASMDPNSSKIDLSKQAPTPVPMPQGQPVQQERPTEIPREVTIPSAPQFTQPVAPVNDSKEKKGLFGGLFSSNKNAPKSSSKKKKGEEAPNGFQGGLAELKNGAKPAPVQQQNQQSPFMTNPQQQSPFMTGNQQGQSQSQSPFMAGTQQGQSQSQSPFMTGAQQGQSQSQSPFMVGNQSGQSQSPFPAQRPVQPQQPVNAFNGGTTVLNNGRAEAPAPSQPQAAFGSGTTVLRNPSAEPAPQPAMNSQENRPVSSATTVLNPQSAGYSSATTVLNKSMQKQCFLIRVKNHQRLQLNKPVIHIGRDLPEIDFNISDNTNVGHKHANLVQRDNGYCVIDLNSINHTYLNGTMLESGKEYPLSNEDKLRFADEEFEFMIM